MKKKKIGLSLSKKAISNLNSSRIMGGDDPNNTIIYGVCTPDDKKKKTHVPCQHDGPAPTAEQGCTLDTINLSYCETVTIPDPCLSTGACA